MINREGLCYIILSPPPTYWRELHKQVLWDSDFSRENFSIQRSTFPRCPSRVIVPHTLKSLNQFIYIFFSFDFEQNFKMFFLFMSTELHSKQLSYVFILFQQTVWNGFLFMRSELHSNADSIWLWTDFQKRCKKYNICRLFLYLSRYLSLCLYFLKACLKQIIFRILLSSPFHRYITP